MKIKSILNKKGVLGLDTAKLFVLAILSLVIIAVVTLIVLDALDNVSTSGDYLDNTTNEIIGNTSDALSDFFNDTGTWFTLIGVVIIILIIAVVIVVINRFGTGGGTFSGTPQTANI